MSTPLFNPELYYAVLWTMTILPVVVFVALHYVTAGYGVMYTKKWGPTINNRAGWVCMEAPVFFAMLAIWLTSPRAGEAAPICMASLFMFHYFQRSFIFPFLIRGKGRMPWSVILMGVVFNVINAYLIGGWIFYLAPADMYPTSWIWSPLFILGTVVFLAGFLINLHSDYIIRHLRKPGERVHRIPYGGMYRYVTSANYFGELVEWIGFAILSWSWAGVVFVLWTFANLAPRARSLHKRYVDEFGDQYTALHRRYILPFIY